MNPPGAARSRQAYPAEDRRLKVAGLALALCGGVGLAAVADALAGQWLHGTAHLVPFVVLAMVAGNLLALGSILLAVGCGSARTLRDPRRRRAVVLQVLVANALVPVVLLGGALDDAAATAALAPQGLDLLLAFAGYAVVLVAWRLWRRSRRVEAVSADEAMALDARPPVLYLRSFRDDGVALAAQEGSALRRRLLRALSLPTPEEHLARILAHVGPLIAIGKPGEPLPELGAARLYVSHDQWQQQVRALMQRAALVVVRVGASPGVLWEIDQALMHLPRQRLVLAILGGDPVAPELVARLAPILGLRLEAALSQPVGGSWRDMLWGRRERRIGGMVCFDADGQATAVPVRQHRKPWVDIDVFKRVLRSASGPLEAAWKEVFACTGLVWDEPQRVRSRSVALVLALALGLFGAHWFYLGNTRRGWIYVATLPLAMAPFFMSVADAFRFVWIDRAEFELRMIAPCPC